MLASELIKVLEKRPDAEVLVIAGKDKSTFVVEDISTMAHTVFLLAEKTPYEYDKSQGRV
jgi:hypothetical protein